MGLAILSVKFIQLSWRLISTCLMSDVDDIVVNILSMFDIAMVGNLILIVMFSGYENFVSRLDITEHPDYPKWIGHVTFGDLKLKLMASIVAMSAIHLLTDLIRVTEISQKELIWGVIIHFAFLASCVLLAIMDKIMGQNQKARSSDH